MKNYLHLSRNAYISNTAAVIYAANLDDYTMSEAIELAAAMAESIEKKGLATWTPQPQEKPKKEDPKKPETVLTAKIILDYQPEWGTLTIRSKSELHLGFNIDGKANNWLKNNESFMTNPTRLKLELPINIGINVVGREMYRNTLTITRPGIQEFLVDLKANGGAK